MRRISREHGHTAFIQSRFKPLDFTYTRLNEHESVSISIAARIVIEPRCDSGKHNNTLMDVAFGLEGFARDREKFNGIPSIARTNLRGPAIHYMEKMPIQFLLPAIFCFVFSFRISFYLSLSHSVSLFLRLCSGRVCLRIFVIVSQ